MQKIIKTQRGMSLIEWLVASIIGGIAILGMMQFAVYFQKAGTTMHHRETSASELRQIIYEIQQTFFQRIVPSTGDPAPYQLIPSTAFVAEATETCQGLLVRQRNISQEPAVIRKVQYEVYCVPQTDNSDMKGVPWVHPKLSCSPTDERALLRKTVWPNEQILGTKTVTDYPVKILPTISLAVCFRGKTAMLEPVVEVEGGLLFKSGSQISQVNENLAMRVSDKSETIEFVPLPKAP